jgi:hypothetical protein
LCFAWSVFFVCCLVVPFWVWNGWGDDVLTVVIFFYGWGNRWLVVMIYENEWDDDIGGRDYFVKNEWGDWW